MLHRGADLCCRAARLASALVPVSHNVRHSLRVTRVTLALHASAALQQLRRKHQNFPSRPKPPPDSEIEEFFLKGSGPGGQKINKTNSAVQLRHIPTGIVVKSQATRSRSQNRTIARQLLADKLDDLFKGDQSRAAVVGAVRAKKKASSAKKSRRKYRKLEDEKAGARDDEEDDLGSEEEGQEGQEGALEQQSHNALLRDIAQQRGKAMESEAPSQPTAQSHPRAPMEQRR
jgi:peptide chain release factor